MYVDAIVLVLSYSVIANDGKTCQQCLIVVSFPDRFFPFLFSVVHGGKRVWWISVGTFVLLDLQILGVVKKC